MELDINNLKKQSINEIFILFDGDCFFCTNYIKIIDIRKKGYKVKLINIRDHKNLNAQAYDLGINFDDGMLVIYDNQLYFAGDAINIMSILSERANLLNKINYFFFKNKRFSSFIYPFLKSIRNLTLKLLGRNKINS